MKKETQLTNQIRKLEYQLSYSEYVNKQLSQQLNNIFEKTGLTHNKTKYDQNVNIINTKLHLQQLYYVQPLLLAYQHKITLLEQQMKVAKQEAQDLKQLSKQIVAENNFLRGQLEKKIELIISNDQIGINLNFIKLDNQNLTQINQMLKDKNTLLEKQLKQISQAKKQPNIHIYNHQQLQKVINELKETNRSLQIQIIQSNKLYQIANNQLINQQAINQDQQRKINQLENQILKYKNQIKIVKQQYQTYHTTHQAISSNLQTDNTSLKTQLQTSIRRQGEMFNKTMLLEAEIQDKNNRLHNLTLQNTQLQTNNNNLLQMLQTYQVKVNTLNKTIKTLQNQNNEHNQGSSEYQKNIELMEWKLSEKERQVQRKEIQWKKQRDRITKMWEQRIQNIRKALQQQKNQLYQQIQSLKSEKVKLQIKLKKIDT